MKTSSFSDLLTAAISEYMKEHGFSTAQSINGGGCEDFMMAMLDKFGEQFPDLQEQCTEIFLVDDDGLDYTYMIEHCGMVLPDTLSRELLDSVYLPGHVWLCLDGLHYDSECPEGVSLFLDLPIFKRAIARKTQG